MQGIKIPAPDMEKLLSNPQAATATFSITYLAAGQTDPWGAVCLTFPENAKTAFDAAAAIWANTLESSVPITIRACWANLGASDILGYSGGQPLHRDFSGAPLPNTWYQGSLANSLSGSDLAPSDFDMNITYNSNFSWYYGTDANPPVGQFDLITVAAHEIAHGINFSGSATYSGGSGFYGYSFDPNKYPNIYDTFMENGGGTKLTVFTNPSTSLGSLLTSGDLWFDGNNANVANGGSRVKMYAPGTWAGGSSYSHLDYTTFAGTINSMMVYAVSDGSANHNPGPVSEGLLNDLGWMSPALNAPTLNAIDNSDSDGNYTVSWSAVSLAAQATNLTDTPLSVTDVYTVYLPLVMKGVGTTYTLQEDDNAGFTSPTEVYNGPDTSWSATGKAAGTYYYRVMVSNSNGDSIWSNIQSVTVNPAGGTGIVNGNFESGSTGWTEYSFLGYQIILSSSELPVTPHSGSYAAWLGGDDDETSYVQQQVTISAGAPYLVYWHWIDSTDLCGYDVGGVIVNSSDVVDVYDLCATTATGGWVSHSVNLSAYVGQSITLEIRAETDSSIISSLFVDDVSLQASALASERDGGFLNLDASNTQGKVGIVIQREIPQSINNERLLNSR